MENKTKNLKCHHYKKEAKNIAENKAKELNVSLKSDWDKNYSVLEACVDFEILKANLSESELRYLNKWCEKHEDSSPNKKGKYPCGCIYYKEDEWGEHCSVGLWLNGNMDTECLIEMIRFE